MLLQLIILILAIPTGLLIAHLTKEELKQGKFYFRILIILSIIGSIGFWIFGFPDISLTFAFILIVSLISFIKGKNRKL